MATPSDGRKPKGGKKNRKWKRNKVFCERYRREGREEINRMRKILRHEKRMNKRAGHKGAADPCKISMPGAIPGRSTN